MDPQIAAWLLDPADSASCFQTLLSKHYSHSVTSTSLQPVLGQAKVRYTHLIQQMVFRKDRKRSVWVSTLKLHFYSGIVPLFTALSGDSSDLKHVSLIQSNGGTA